MIFPEWVGETCFIIGCGPSLIGFNARQLIGRGRIIAINDSFELVPFADVLYFCDLRWWQTRRQRVHDIFQGRKIITLENDISGVLNLKNTGATGLETDPAGLRHGSNSGYQAINLAYHYGATRIILLGYDMKVSGEKLHWNDRSDGQNAAGFQRTLNNMVTNFRHLKEPLAQAGVEVINCNPGSALRVWPCLPLSKVLQQANVR